MNVILDICAIIWSVSEPDRLSPDARTVLKAPATRVCVSVISCAEIACLAQADKIAVKPHHDPSHCLIPNFQFSTFNIQFL